MIQCPDTEFSDFCHSKLQPLISTSCRTTSDFSARNFVAEEDFKTVAQKVERSSSLVWAVVYGHRVGIFLDRYVGCSMNFRTYCLPSNCLALKLSLASTLQSLSLSSWHLVSGRCGKQFSACRVLVGPTASSTNTAPLANLAQRQISAELWRHLLPYPLLLKRLFHLRHLPQRNLQASRPPAALILEPALPLCLPQHLLHHAPKPSRGRVLKQPVMGWSTRHPSK